MLAVPLFSVTGFGPSFAARKLASAALVALAAQVPLALVTVIMPVVASIEHPVPVALNETLPVPSPPEVVAVPVAPKVMLAGTVRLKPLWLAWPMWSLTVLLASL